MRQRGGYTGISKIAIALGGMLLWGVQAQGQASSAGTIPDAQIEANVLKALAGAPQVSNENIITDTLDGTVTLSGSVKDEPTRVMAETIASKAHGVRKVVDELSIGTNAMPPGGSADSAAAPAQHAPDPDTYAAQHGYDTAPQGNMPPDDSANNGAAQNGQSYDGPPPEGGDPGYAGNGQQAYPGNQQPSPQGGYGTQQNAPPPYGAQVAGRPVTVPPGALLRIRINQGLDSKHTQPGTPFDAIVLNDVVADGAVAIPRGASVQGTVVDAKSGGVLKGHGELALSLNQVTLGGRTFPITSDVWSRDSAGKGSETVGNAVGLGAVGALIGAIAGGGAGAAIGAGVGGAAGIGSSAASGSRQVLIPPEAILTFHLAQPAPLTTISQAEMDRLSYGVPAGGRPPQMRRRYPPPPPPYYGRGYYPPPY